MNKKNRKNRTIKCLVLLGLHLSILQAAPVHFEKNAQNALLAMQKKAKELKIQGVGIITYIPKKQPDQWGSKVIVVDKLTNGAKGNAKGYNFLAIAYAKTAEMARTLKNSGTSGSKIFVGETGWKGGCIEETKSGYVIAAFSGGPSALDLKISQSGLKAFQKTEHFTPLFNGKNLTGWSVACLDKDKDKNYWSVKNGSIVLDTKGDKNHDYMWLISDEEFVNFELTLSFKTLRKTTGNTGIQIRSRYKDHPKKIKWMHGPQIDIHPATPFRTGLIYDETFENQRWISPSLPSSKISLQNIRHKPTWHNDWNTLVIRAESTTIKTWLNGSLVTDYNGQGTLDDAVHKKHQVGMHGHIALQLHSKSDIAIAFKNISIKRLQH